MTKTPTVAAVMMIFQADAEAAAAYLDLHGWRLELVRRPESYVRWSAWPLIEVDAVTVTVPLMVDTRTAPWTEIRWWQTADVPIAARQAAKTYASAFDLQMTALPNHWRLRDLGWCRRVLRQARPDHWTNRRLRRMRLSVLRACVRRLCLIRFRFAGAALVAVDHEGRRLFVQNLGQMSLIAAASVARQWSMLEEGA